MTTEQPAEQTKPGILFYCKDCGEIVDTERCGKKYVYKCRKCGTKNVAFGTKKSIYSFFHVQDEPAKVEEPVAVKTPVVPAASAPAAPAAPEVLTEIPTEK